MDCKAFTERIEGMNNNPEQIKELIKKTALYLNGEYNETTGGVPRIIVSGTFHKFSVVYVAKADKWKVFFPFPATDEQQSKEYFNCTEDLFRYLKSQGVKFDG